MGLFFVLVFGPVVLGAMFLASAIAKGLTGWRFSLATAILGLGIIDLVWGYWGPGMVEGGSRHDAFELIILAFAGMIYLPIGLILVFMSFPTRSKSDKSDSIDDQLS